MALAIVILTAGVLALATGMFVVPAIQNRKLHKKIQSEFGKVSSTAHGLVSSENFWSGLVKKKQVSNNYIDEITWHDLDMDQVYTRLNNCQSSVGDALLYTGLRQPDAPPLPAQQMDSLISFLRSHPQMLESIRFTLAKLGRNQGGNVSMPYLFPEMLELEYIWIFRLLAALPFLSLLLLFWFSFRTVFLLILLLLALNSGLVLYFKSKNDTGFFAVRYLASVLACAKALSKIIKPIDPETGKQLAMAVQPFHSFSRSVQVLRFNELFTEGMGMICPLTPLLIPLLSYGRIARLLVGMSPQVGRLYELVGSLDLASSMISVQESFEYWCPPTYTNEPLLSFKDLCHPLLGENAVPNSANFSNDILLTGSNASGKSTFLKAIAINCITAQSLQFCTAAQFTLKKGSIHSSMAVADSILDGDSYFIAEIKSMKRLLDPPENNYAYIFIDEILKGTNTVERVAAASSVIQYLHQQNGLCFAATHDIELTRILAPICDNYHFRETVDAQGVHFDYQLHTGPSTSRNAIHLLESMQFPPSVLSQAHTLVQRFEQTGKWTDSSHIE